MLLAITWAMRSAATIGSRSSLQFLSASWTFASACAAGQSAIHTIARRSGSAGARAHRRPRTARRTGIWRHLRPRLGRSPRAKSAASRNQSCVKRKPRPSPSYTKRDPAYRYDRRDEARTSVRTDDRIRSGQFELASLRVNGKTAPEIWNEFSLHKPNHVFDVDHVDCENLHHHQVKRYCRYTRSRAAKPPTAPYDQQQAPRFDIAAKKVFNSRAA